MSYKQDNRFISIHSPLGPDKLLLTGFVCREEISRLFEIDADVASEDEAVDFDKLLGLPVTIRLVQEDGKPRFFAGIVAKAVQLPPVGELARYRLHIVPWLWLLSRRTNCRIFQNLATPEIVKAIFGEYPSADFEFNLTGDYRAREYVVQYRETDFEFVCRLLEEEGIFFLFKHDDEGKHTLQVIDAPSAYQPCPGCEKVDVSDASGNAHNRPGVVEWVYEKSVHSGKFATTDFNFKKPLTPLLAAAVNEPPHAAKKLEVYDPPGKHQEKAEGDELAKLRLQEIQCRQEAASGKATVRGLITGHTFSLIGPARDKWKDVKWLVTEAVHRAKGDDFTAEKKGTKEQEYACAFCVVDAATLWRPARSTRKPMITGPQTAIVCGPEGEEIFTDEYGRVLVKFHWDRESKGDEKSTCFIRVAQGWAGKQMGFFMLPRIGHEVVVEFLEGDPDRPLITGSVYNGENKQPYALPDHSSVSTWKSLSTPGGGGFNEIRFEDKKDAEQVFIHAQKNMDVRVNNDMFETVTHDRHSIVENDDLYHVKHDRDEIVDNDHREKVGKDRNLTVKGKEAKQVDGSRSLKVAGDVAEEFGAGASRVVTGDYYVKADSICLEAASNITLIVGGSSIAVGSGGITIKAGSQVVIEGSGVDVKGSGQVQIGGPAITVSADGTLTLKGGMVMIN